ncbi:hypothetical protein R6242_14715 [Iodobacter sp. CM08]|uniref:hypothetical protein n=1 Tax=Iodobacter sp. CM08 TaxID=3085902 RepID=UPI002981B3F2|nr:hypothetical protein [Iodobacter sp. CM08]MDW5417821.1 hypothetical protein [Iodobacter sp. CM08]
MYQYFSFKKLLIIFLCVVIFVVFLLSSRVVPQVQVGKITAVDDKAGLGWNIAIISDIDFKSENGEFINTTLQCPLFEESADKYNPDYSAKLRIFGSDVAELNSKVNNGKENSLLYQSVFTVRLEKIRSGSAGGYDWVLGGDITDILNKIDKVNCKIVATRYLFSPVYSREITILSRDLLLNYKE